MSNSTALQSTNAAVDDALTHGTRTFSFGQPLSETSGGTDIESTKESSVRKTVQITSDAPQTITPRLTLDEFFKPIKNWEGVVESVSDTSFIAAMRDAEDPVDRGEEQFEIDLDDVDPGDRELVAPGAIFYFTVGYRIRRGGTRIKGVQIVFRRMPRWSKKDISRVRDRAEVLYGIMSGEERLVQRG